MDYDFTAQFLDFPGETYGPFVGNDSQKLTRPSHWTQERHCKNGGFGNKVYEMRFVELPSSSPAITKITRTIPLSGSINSSDAFPRGRNSTFASVFFVAEIVERKSRFRLEREDGSPREQEDPDLSSLGQQRVHVSISRLVSNYRSLRPRIT